MAAKNRIKSIGLELEGGWQVAPAGIKHDGSVQGLTTAYHGEVCSTPLRTIETAEQWLRTNYPHEVNSSCGFHVHVALPALHYSYLMNPQFNEKFLLAMEDFWNRYRGQPGFDLFRSRLDGQNQYCQKIFRPEEQLWRTEAYGDRNRLPRYSQLNYCYGRHGTMECRLFPCFPSVQHSVEGMHAFLNSINEFLATCKPMKPVEVSLTSEDIGTVDTVVNQPTRVATV